MKRRFPGLTDSDFQLACSAALKNRRKMFPNAKSVERKEIEAAISKNLEVLKETTNVDQMEVEDDQDLESNHACKSCGKRYVKIANLMKHIQKVHQTQLVKQFKCGVCEQVMKTKKTLKIHVKSHMKPDIKCDECGEMLTSKHRLKCHIRNEHEEIVCN